MKTLIKFILIATATAILTPCFARAQSPTVPNKSPGLPSNNPPAAVVAPRALASPQVQVQVAPQQTYQAPQAEPAQPVVVLRAAPSVQVVQAAPSVVAVQRQVVVQAEPVVYSQASAVVYSQADPVVYAQVAYAASDPCVVQQGSVRQAAVYQQILQQDVIDSPFIKRQILQQDVIDSPFIKRQILQQRDFATPVIQSATVNHALIGGAGRQPRKIVTKQVTKTKRGLLGGLFGG